MGKLSTFPADDIVTIKNLSRRFGSKLALNDVSLCAPAAACLVWSEKTVQESPR